MQLTTPTTHRLSRAARRLAALALALAASLSATPRAAVADDCQAPGPVLSPVTTVLSSNRFSGLPNGRLQVTALYDGSVGAPAGLRVQLADPSGAISWIELSASKFNIATATGTIVTEEYAIGSLSPTGVVQVVDAVPDGVVDGLAFGLYWRDTAGGYHHVQSGSYTPQLNNHFVGTWPLGMNDTVFQAGTPAQEAFARHQARMMVYGAELLPSGCYELPICSWTQLPSARPIGSDTIAPQPTLSSNRFHGMPNGTIQVTALYDGNPNQPAVLGIELRDWAGNEKWIRIEVNKFTQEIVMREYFAPGFGLTGRFVVEGVVPDGVIDGLAFGVLWRDYAGYYRTVQSDDCVPHPASEYVGGWPFIFSDASFAQLLGNSSFPAQQARSMLYGAKLVGNGEYQHAALHVPEPVTLDLQPGAEGKDSFVHELLPDDNWGDRAEMHGADWTYQGTPATTRALIDFDLSSIPAGAEIESASLYLYENRTTGNFLGGHSTLSGSNEAWLRRVTSPWDEAQVTWNTQPTTTTTNQLVVPASTSQQQDYVLDVTALVEDMLADPAGSHGFELRLQTEQYYRALVFATGDHPDATLRPRLVIDYIK